MTSVMAKRPVVSTRDLVHSYLKAKRVVIEAGYADELDWQRDCRIERVTAVDFLREASWVVLSAGMSEKVIASVFPRLSVALHGFAPEAVCGDPTSRDNALRVFGHRRKIDAILVVAETVRHLGDDLLRKELSGDPLAFVSRLPYMGPATSRHLAKNLGLSVAKPDRHLLRIAVSAARDSVDILCQEISSWLGEPVAVVDIVLWRWATIHSRRCVYAACAGLPHD